MRAPEPVTVERPDGTMAGWLWSRPDAPRIVFWHANGFTARTYARMLAPLAEQFEVAAFDLRGHGRTALPAHPAALNNWHGHAADIAAAADALEARDWIGAGHSMGAVSLLMGSARMKRPPRALALIEPVVLPRSAYFAAHTPLWPLAARRMTLARGALRRRAAFASRADALERFKTKPPFDGWAEGVIEDYLREGLIETPNGVRLACDPAWEAANYAAQRHWPLGAARGFDGSIHALKAEHGSTVLNEPGLAKAGARIDTLPGAGHLAPMQAPRACADWLTTRAQAAFSL